MLNIVSNPCQHSNPRTTKAMEECLGLRVLDFHS
jgi:hypothetical protein